MEFQCPSWEVGTVNDIVLNFRVSKGQGGWSAKSVEFERPSLEVGSGNATVLNFNVSKGRGV